ncbi:MAG: DegT/DnrJ/EryC1/StrS family aminotransferase [Miltoncostaeaceae bacterium]
MTPAIPLAVPSFDEEEERAVLDVVRSRWLTMGPRVEEFEGAFADAIGAPHAVMTSSCTTALHLTFAASGIGPGDEVIVPSLTFVATANAAAYTGAEVRFADIASLERPVMSAEATEALIGPRTAAICVVHFAGYVPDMEPFRRLAERHSLALIEDAAHAPGALGPDGAAAGTLADAGCFSFFSNKNLVTGEGGMITTADESLAARARTLRAHGMTATTWDRDRGHASGYDVIERGYNYRPTEVEAALGLVQLDKLGAMTARRRELVCRYREVLPADVGAVPFEGEDGRSACHILPFVCHEAEMRDRIRGVAAERQVQTSVHYSPVHGFTTFGAPLPLAVTEDFSRREVTLPLYPGMSDDDVAVVADVVSSTPRS